MSFNESAPKRIPTPHPDYTDPAPYLRAEIHKVRHELFEQIYQIHRRLDSLETLVRVSEDDGK